jgi:hypothetical protein
VVIGGEGEAAQQHVRLCVELYVKNCTMVQGVNDDDSVSPCNTSSTECRDDANTAACSIVNRPGLEGSVGCKEYWLTDRLLLHMNKGPRSPAQTLP